MNPVAAVCNPMTGVCQKNMYFVSGLQILTIGKAGLQIRVEGGTTHKIMYNNMINKLKYKSIIVLFFIQTVAAKPQLEGVYQLNLDDKTDCYIELYAGQYILSLDVNYHGSDIFQTILLSAGNQQLKNDTLYLTDNYNNTIHKFRQINENALEGSNTFAFLNSKQLKFLTTKVSFNEIGDFLGGNALDANPRPTVEKYKLNDLYDYYCNDILKLHLNKSDKSFKCYISDFVILDGIFTLTDNVISLTDQHLKQMFFIYVDDLESLEAKLLPGFRNNHLIFCPKIAADLQSDD